MSSRIDSRFSRRGFGGLVGTATVGTLAGTVPDWTPASAANEETFTALRDGRSLPRPNILVIIADDLGWADLSCYGAPGIRTPNLDRLAASGVRFTDGYAASSTCSPTRFALYTGRYPGRLPGGLQEPIGPPSETDGIPLDHPTLATLLKGRGYETAMIGKWHCGYLPWFSPTRLGWDSFFGNFGGGLDYFTKQNTNKAYDLYEGEVEYEDLRYYTQIITERATDFIRKRHSATWLLNVNFTTPHWPWEGPGDKSVSDELAARIEAGDPAVLLHEDGGSPQTYAEMVEDLDKAVGKIVSALRGSGQLERTLVFFASDNGGERYSYSWPFSGAKDELLEGGIRVPMIASWPGRLRPNQVSHEPVGTMDWTRTFVELGGADPHPNYALDGVSLVDYLFHGEPIGQRDLFWRTRDWRALRRGNLKYVRLPDGSYPGPLAGPDRLHDLSVDPREEANFAVKRSNDLAAMRDAWEAIDETLLPYPPPPGPPS